ncbi:MAG: phosphoglucosamine mutase [Halopenitus sp.]
MFGTSGIRGEVGETITADLAVDLGRALASYGADSVVVGRDPRPTGEFLADAISAGLRECGADVVDVGMASNPTIARSVSWQDADAGVAITASHNPASDNGFKLWTPSGQAFNEGQRQAISDLLEGEAVDLPPWDQTGSKRSWEGAVDRHVDALLDATGEVDPLDVVVDVGNGAGAVTARALDELGCHVETLNAQPDGRFPARPSEPTAEHCKGLIEYVEATDADLGIAHDGDADRMRAIDDEGQFLAGDTFLALFGRDAAGDGDTVAAPVNTSLAVNDALDSVGASLTRTKVGDVYVAEAATDDDVVFGGEPSGAWIWPAETLCPDGPLAACQLVELVSRRGPLSTLADAVDNVPIRRESIQVDEKRDVMAQVAADVQASYDDVTTIDGVHVDVGDGWFLVRASGTQPLIRLTAEARDRNRCEELLATAREFVEPSN